MIAIISDKGEMEYSKWLVKSLEEIGKHDVKGIALVVLCGDENLTGYWNMCQRDRAQAETEIRYDVIDGFIKANIDRYFSPNEDEDNEDHGGDEQ